MRSAHLSAAQSRPLTIVLVLLGSCAPPREARLRSAERPRSPPGGRGGPLRAHRCAAVFKLRQPLMHLLTSSSSQLPTRGTSAEHKLHTLSSLCVALSQSHIHFLSWPVCV
ncbi:hypothetical protein QQF64_030382 [Cirrhinus molitorella]|uniref:Secreted protein n=1 Tax=Cirrhinus molitorella TaxID=172907 RepID=A0ABR3N3G7_9TELE